MKKCFICSDIKPLKDYYRHSKMADGHLGKCKSCTRRHTSERHARMSQNPEWVESEIERHRQKSRLARSLGKVSPHTNKGKIAWEQRNEHKRKAHFAVANALRDGKIEKLPCMICGKSPAQAHHDDYSKPLDVRWLCVTHHNEHHNEVRKAIRMERIKTYTDADAV